MKERRKRRTKRQMELEIYIRQKRTDKKWNITRTIRGQLGYRIEGETISACKIFMLERRGTRRCSGRGRVSE